MTSKIKSKEIVASALGTFSHFLAHSERSQLSRCKLP